MAGRKVIKDAILEGVRTAYVDCERSTCTTLTQSSGSGNGQSLLACVAPDPGCGVTHQVRPHS